MKFTKMQGLGNDYVYVNCLEEMVPDPEETARLVSDRHFGVGSDGLILICPSKAADFEMRMYNADGSRGEMCGNGIRCVGKYVYDYGLTDKTDITVETLAGIKYLEIFPQDGKAQEIKVDMGAPVVSAIDSPIEVNGQEYRITEVSMGNPHAVLYIEDVQGLAIEKIGPCFEMHPRFPNRVNTEFARVLDRQTVEMRVWERGSGETLACGTGACAVAVASMVNGLTEHQVTVRLLGGDLKIQWDGKGGSVYMTGPARTVFEGEIDLEHLDVPGRNQ